jgi:hypothetical protein
MADIEKDGSLQQIDGENVLTLNLRTKASLVRTADGSDAQTEINALKAAVGGAAKFYTADNIAGMYALEATPGVNVGDRCYVIDATDDEAVAAGGAEYLWVGDWWSKISEAESMDLVTNWADIQNKPTSSAEHIDEAVSMGHVHDNKNILDNIEEGDNGLPTYNGEQIGGLKVVPSIPNGAADGLYFVTVNGGGE